MYKIIFHKEVTKDLKDISLEFIKAIRVAINERLSARPYDFRRSYLNIVFWAQKAVESLINQEKSELYLYTSVKHLVYQGFLSKNTILR